MQKEDARADAAIRELVVRKSSLRKMWILGSMSVGWGAVEVAAGLGLLGVSMGSPVLLGLLTLVGTINMVGAGVSGISVSKSTSRARGELEAMRKEKNLYTRSPHRRIDIAGGGSVDVKELAKKMLDENVHAHELPGPFAQDEKKEDVKGKTVVCEDYVCEDEDNVCEDYVDSAPKSTGSVLNALPNAETMVAKIQKRHALEGQRVLLESGAIKPPGRGRMRA